jgi:hypothetical protein
MMALRHFLFVLPPLAILSGVSIANILETATRRTAFILGGAAILCGGLVAGEMARLHPNQVVYFNHFIAGGVDKAWRRYETDYWRHAQKQAAVWISENYGPRYDRPIRIASRFVHTRHQMPENLLQVDFRALPDFYIGSTRYDEHLVIPGEIIHILKARQDAELAHIVRPDDKYLNDPRFTGSFIADLHRRKIYLRGAEYLENSGNPVGAAKEYLKLARCYERLLKNTDALNEPPRNCAKWHYAIRSRPSS